MTDEAATAEVAVPENPNDEIALRRLPALGEVGAALGLPAGAMHVNGLTLTNPDTTFEEWQQYGHVIGAFGRWHRFGLGDWLNFGEAIFGEDAAQAVEGTAVDRYDVAHRITGLQVPTLQNYASISGRIALNVRRTELDFSAHEPVAALDREEQIYWLDQAVTHGFDRSELRQAIKDAKHPPSEDDDPDDGVVVEPPLTRTERLEQAVMAMYHSWQPTSDGSYLVSPEAAARVIEAIGEE